MHQANLINISNLFCKTNLVSLYIFQRHIKANSDIEVLQSPEGPNKFVKYNMILQRKGKGRRLDQDRQKKNITTLSRF